MAVELTTRVLKADREAIAEGARVLADGGLVAFPTETVYGLGANAFDDKAVARLYAAKGRPRFNPLIVHVPDTLALREFAVLDDDNAALLAVVFWPGPLTLVLPQVQYCPISELALAGHDTVAVRVPDNPFAFNLMKALNRPIVAPSANRS